MRPVRHVSKEKGPLYASQTRNRPHRVHLCNEGGKKITAPCTIELGAETFGPGGKMDTILIAFATVALTVLLGIAIGKFTDALIKSRPENQNVQPPDQPGIKNHPYND